MSKFIYGDLWDLEKEFARKGKVLVLAAVNMTKVGFNGKPLSSYHGCGSMSAGTSLQMVGERPSIATWWARKLFKGKLTGGVHISPRVSGKNDYGVFVVKDVWWQESPADADRILWHIENSCKGLVSVSRDYDYVIMPMVGTGFGRLPESLVKPLLVGLPDNVIVVVKE